MLTMLSQRYGSQLGKLVSDDVISLKFTNLNIAGNMLDTTSSITKRLRFESDKLKLGISWWSCMCVWKATIEGFTQFFLSTVFFDLNRSLFNVHEYHPCLLSKPDGMT